MCGGHKEEFVEEIGVILICCHCKRVMRDAMYIPSTRQGICSSCLEVKRNSKGDHTESSALLDSAYGTRMPESNPSNESLDAIEDPRNRCIINDLKVRCPNNDCKAQGLILKDFKNHKCGEEPSTRPRVPSSIQSAPIIQSGPRDCSATSGNAGRPSIKPRKAPPQARPRPQVPPSQNTVTSQYGKTKRDISLQPTPATLLDGKQKFGVQSGLSGTASNHGNINTVEGEDGGAGKTLVRQSATNLVQEFVLSKQLDKSLIDFAHEMETLQRAKDEELRAEVTSTVEVLVNSFHEKLQEQLQSMFASHSERSDAQGIAMEQLSTSLNNLSGRVDQQQELLLSVASTVEEVQRQASAQQELYNQQQDINNDHRIAMAALTDRILTLGTPQPAPAQPAPVTMMFAQSVQARQEEGAHNPGSISNSGDEPDVEERYGEAAADQ